MFAFHYHPQTRAYAGSDWCEFDQLEPGRKIIPAWATAKPPPPMRDGFERFFNPARDEWEYIALDKG